MEIARGQRINLSELAGNRQDFTLGLSAHGPGLVIDFSCFGLDGAGKLSDDRYMTYFNQPRTPCGGVAVAPDAGGVAGFTLSLGVLPSSIQRLVVVAAIDGAGTMAQLASGRLLFLDGARETASFPFKGADFRDERALILGEFYRRDGFWRFWATGQGFNGGLDAIVRHFGGTVSDAPSLAPVGAAKVSLEKRFEKEAPHLVSLAKKAAVSLEKRHLDRIVAKVGLVLDASGSMTGQYRKGDVQAVVDRILPLAVHFDDDGELDTWAFAEKAQELSAVTMMNVKGYVDRESGGWVKWMQRLNAGINYEPAVIRDVIRKYKGDALSRNTMPAYVIFISDGGVGSNHEVERLLVEASKLPIFWQFVGVGGSNYGILERLDTMSGRYIDNCNFFSLDDLHKVSDEVLYERLLNEFPAWLELARSKGIIC